MSGPLSLGIASFVGFAAGMRPITRHVNPAPHFAALPSKAATTPMAIGYEGSGSEMDFSAGVFISLGISVSKSGPE